MKSTVVLAVVMFLILLLLLRRLFQGNTGTRGARQILDERYARVDIDR